MATGRGTNQSTISDSQNPIYTNQSDSQYKCNLSQSKRDLSFVLLLLMQRKCMELFFNSSGQPDGGNIWFFSLEKVSMVWKRSIKLVVYRNENLKKFLYIFTK